MLIPYVIKRVIAICNYMQSQISNIERFGTVIYGCYNACRICNRDCCVNPLTPYSKLQPYACTMWFVIRPHSRRFFSTRYTLGRLYTRAAASYKRGGEFTMHRTHIIWHVRIILKRCDFGTTISSPQKRSHTRQQLL